MAQGFHASDRTVIRVGGRDAHAFLQGLVTNDVEKLSHGAVYAALLTPQGKYLADFLMVPDGGAVLLDVKAELAPGLMQRLGMYRLRAAVELAETPLQVTVVLADSAPDGGLAVADPRDSALGWRVYAEDPAPALAGLAPMAPEEWRALRVRRGIPESGVELVPSDSYILEAGFDRLNGVDHRKGCYVGQEVTARMRHKTELKKGLVQVRVEGAAEPGTGIVTEDGRAAGTLYTTADGLGLAHLRFDRAREGVLRAGSARISPSEAGW
jgi:tRNA-modifying protein YgfZ